MDTTVEDLVEVLTEFFPQLSVEEIGKQGRMMLLKLRLKKIQRMTTERLQPAPLKTGGTR